MTIHPANFEAVDSCADRRSDERMVTMYRAARIVTVQGHEQLGIVRNVSSGGLMIETHATIAIGDRLWIEPRGCQSIWGSVRWSDAPRHGIAFDTPIPFESLLTLAGPEVPNQVARAPRITVDLDARLCVAGRWHLVQLCDLSQSGAKLASDLILPDGGPVQLSIEGLRNADAFVRWQRKGRIGLLFAEPISINRLSAWIAVTMPQTGTDDDRRDDESGAAEQAADSC
jgi:hypothetical protein